MIHDEIHETSSQVSCSFLARLQLSNGQTGRNMSKLFVSLAILHTSQPRKLLAATVGESAPEDTIATEKGQCVVWKGWRNL